MDYKALIKSVQDFPIEGILFRDITPILADKDAYKEITKDIANFAKENGAELICGPESRGFLFGCPVATELNIGFVPIRKPGKLPRETIEESYSLEYGKNTLAMHADAIKPGQKVIIVDDLLATGGTLEAAVKLVEKLGGIVAGIAVVIYLSEFPLSEKLRKYNLFVACKY